ncbi:hypothetical protein MA16_Dca004179 [Dendrobium catenatum]|uniref:Gnk2-homologous domain-containing protein n=1 Tax=Dendrobium catenatum TaxID=906689 RepID=A0A2I0X2N8_9ASPA|nr:hypothetical protein MA16_Dca004179 [Dendrobium catenatum]
MGIPHHLLLLLLLLPFAYSDQYICGDPTENMQIISNAKAVIKALVNLTPTPGSQRYSYGHGTEAVRGLRWCYPNIGAFGCALCVSKLGNDVLKSCNNNIFAISWSGESCYIDFHSG